jgi:transcriptional antiterminator RfaH
MFWAVVQAQPMCEHRAIWHLERQSFTCYAPRERIKRIKRGKMVSDARWLFPRYLFVWVEENWQRWFNTVGVTTVLMNGQEPARLPDDFITNMKAQERNGLITTYKPQLFKRGQQVTVVGGLLDGRKGIYQGQTSRQREIVLLETLGHVELAPGLLR